MIVLPLEIFIWQCLGELNLHLHLLAAYFRYDPVRKEVAGSLDCLLRWLGSVWFQIHTGLSVILFPLCMKTKFTPNCISSI